MQLRIFTEPQQGASYEDLLRVARASERLGFDAFFRSDHYVSMSGDGLPGPTDAWTTLAALARETSKIRLGTLVSPVTFRPPAPLAMTVAQIDVMSGGRIELGLGAGWFEAEHAAFGLPFPPVAVRFEMLDEQLQIIRGLWDTPVGSTFTFTGRHYSVVDAPALPKPLQNPRPPIITGGAGRRRMPALTAAYAAEFNLAFRTLDEVTAAFARVRRACEERGRDPDGLTLSAAQVLCVGADETEFARRAKRIDYDPAQLRERELGGTPEEVVAKIQAYARAGASRLYLQVLDLHDLDHLELVAAEVAPHV